MAKERMLKKLQRLHALASCKSGNPEELETAAAIMTKLMIEYGIEEAELHSFEAEDPEEEYDPLLISQFCADQKNIDVWRGQLVGGLCEAYSCKAIYEHSSSERGKKLKVYGHNSNIQIIRYMFDYLSNEIGRFTDAWSGMTGETGKKPRTAFKLGMAIAIANRLAEAKKAAFDAAAQSTALALYQNKEKELENFFNRMVGRTRKGSAAQIRDMDAYAAGKQYGSKVALGGGKALNPGKKMLND